VVRSERHRPGVTPSRWQVTGVAVGALLVLLIGADVAAACSCRPVDPRDRLREGVPAVIARVVGKETYTDPFFGEGYEYRLQVERGFNLSHGPELSVRTAVHERSCGVDWQVGQRVGAFLSHRKTGWHTSLCHLVDPGELERALLPYPRPIGQGRPALIAAGHYSEARLMALDGRGRILAYGFGKGTTERLSVCPGHRRLVELVQHGSRRRVAIRRLRSLRVLRGVIVPRATNAVYCADKSGSAIFTAAVVYPTERSLGRIEVRAITGRRVRKAAERAGDVVAFAHSHAYRGSR